MIRADRPPTVPATDFEPGTNVRWPAGRFLKRRGRGVDPMPVENRLGDRIRWHAAAERGFTLIEVLMTALLVTLIAGAVAGALMTNIHATAAQHRQTAAQAMAEQDQERLKGLSAEQLDDLSQTYNASFDNYKFTVTSKAWYLSSSNTQACSSSGGASATYFKTISTVAWVNASGASQNLATDESVISPPAGGGILAQFHDQTTSPLSGVAVSATGPDSDAATSDSNGCVIFSALPTGNYNLAFTDTGYVDPNGNSAAPLSATASVASTGFAAPSTGNPVELGQGGSVTGAFGINYGSGPTYPSAQATALSWLSPGGAGIPMASYRTYPAGSSTSTATFQTENVAGTSTSGLFPFVSSLSPVSYTNNYQLWAGKCLQEQPPAGTNTFTVGPAASLTSQVVLVPALLLTTSYTPARGSATAMTPSDVKATFTSSAGSGTSCSDEWSAAASGVSSGVNVYGIPFASSSASGSGASSSGQTGSVSVCIDYKPSGSSTYYQSTLSGLTPGFTSTISKTVALTSTSTTGKCT